jgi:selenophosphate synthase
MSDDFWQNVLQYRELGLDPLRWITNSINEVDSMVLCDFLRQNRRSNHLLDYSWYDAFPYCGKNPDLIRRMYDIKDPKEQSVLRTKRIVSLFNIHSETTDYPRELSKMLLKFYFKINPKHPVRCFEISTTSNPKAEFALLDFIELHRGEKIGYTVIKSSCIKVIDPFQSPDSDINTAISLATSVEYLALLGCTSGFRIVPIYDAPNQDMINHIQDGHSLFSSKYNIPVDDYSSLNLGKLFLGGTAYANIEKEMPVRYDLVRSGMVIMLTDKFGSLCPLNARMIEKIDPKFNGFTNLIDHFSPTISNDVLKSLSHPRFSLGKIVAKYSPDFDNKFDTDSHIIAVHPVVTDGVISLLHLAKLSNSHLFIKDIPMKYKELAMLATKECVISNSTSSTNGCHIIVAGSEVATNVLDDLKKHNFDPQIIGNVVDNEKPVVTINNSITNYVAAKNIVDRFELRNVL